MTGKQLPVMNTLFELMNWWRRSQRERVRMVHWAAGMCSRPIRVVSGDDWDAITFSTDPALIRTVPCWCYRAAMWWRRRKDNLP